MSSEKVAYLGMEFNIIAEQLPRCEVRRADAHLSIEHDDCSIDVLEQRLQAIPLVTQIVLLPPNRLRHVAECRDQKAEIGIRRHRHIDIELSSSHIARPANECLNGSRHRARRAIGDNNRSEDDEDEQHVDGGREIVDLCLDLPRLHDERKRQRVTRPRSERDRAVDLDELRSARDVMCAKNLLPPENDR